VHDKFFLLVGGDQKGRFQRCQDDVLQSNSRISIAITYIKKTAHCNFLSTSWKFVVHPPQLF